MFDLRYHVASLAAVFLALIIGILIGVGISSGGFIKTSERSLLNRQIGDLQKRLDSSTKRAADLAEEQAAAQTFVTDAYPALMAGRLRGAHVALVFVGATDDRIRSLVERALVDAGAQPPVRVRSLKVPIDFAKVDRLLAARPAFSAYIGDKQARDLGLGLAQEFVFGGETPLWNTLSQSIDGERAGGARIAANAVVVVRTAEPQQGVTSRFLDGFYSGLGTTSLPAAGVDTSDAAFTAVEIFAKNHVSTVDDLDTPAGRLGLAILLSGGKTGQYGVKPSAKNGLLPPVEPVPTPTLPGG
jgi:copper transport outer membrane protein MctB